MILVKVIDGEIVQFPYTLDDLRADNPNVSFPVNMTSEILQHYSAYQVLYQPYPVYDQRTQFVNAAQVPVLIDGVWTMVREVANKEPEVIAEYDNDILKTLRDHIFIQVDIKTNERIVFGCTYLGRKVRLNAEDQNNFEGEYSMIKDYLNDGVPEQYIFPTKFKVWTNEIDGTPEFLEFLNLSQMKSFIYHGKIYIKQCLASGWDIKNALSLATIDELRAWVDPR